MLAACREPALQRQTLQTRDNLRHLESPSQKQKQHTRFNTGEVTARGSPTWGRSLSLVVIATYRGLIEGNFGPESHFCKSSSWSQTET